MTEETTELVLPSRIESASRAAAVASEAATRWGFSDEASYQIDLAVREAVSNAIIHGNQQDERKNVNVVFTNAEIGLIISVRDGGAGFDPELIPDPTSQQNLLNPNGRGILFIRAFMDEVNWERLREGGMEVRMTKKRVSGRD